MMTISYRMLGAIVAVVLLFGVGAAFVVDSDDDDATASDDTTTTEVDEPDDDGEEKGEEDETTTTRGGTSSTSSTATTAGGASTTATTAAPGATTSTTRRPGATTTAAPAPTTTAAPSPQPTAPGPTAPPPESADLLVHAEVSGNESVRTAVVTVENAGPGRDIDLRLTVGGAGAPVRSVQAGSGFSCSDNGSTVTCNASGVGIGGRVRTVTVQFEVQPGCPGAPVLTAVVSSATPDPNPGNNNLSPRSLCPAAG